MSDSRPQSASLIDRVLHLTWGRLALVALAWMLAVFLHNLIYGLLYTRFAPGWDEPVFFVIAALVIPAYFVVASIYTGATLIRGRSVRG